jgi:hypothetical protein
MGQMPQEVRDRIAKARASAGGNNIRHGEYVLMLLKSTYEKMHSGWCHINEFLVIESKKIAVMEGEKKLDVDPNSPGSLCSVVINYDGKGKLSADGNSKAIVLGLFGLKEEQVKDELVSETLGDLTHDRQPAKGMLIKCSTYPKEVRSRPGSYITGIKWECADKPGEGLNTSEKVKERLDMYAAQQKKDQKAS